MSLQPQLISTSPAAAWRRQSVRPSVAGAAANLAFSGSRHQTWEAWGGCFNELGWLALAGLPERRRRQVLQALFDPADGCRFNFCRLPIGASDYAADWYSLNEHAGDHDMKQFSLARDRQCLLRYIRAALAIRPDLHLFASPWSPPTWMKNPGVYNHGTLVWTPQVLRAYALYFVKFVQGCAAEGVPIRQVHVQNEPLADQKFPSCVWTGAQLRDFIRDYLAPAFRRHRLATEIWLGTLNTDDFHGYPSLVFADPRAQRQIAGVGLQWAGKGMVQRIHASWPELRIFQTENECGDGRNSWAYAHYVFDLLQHYISNGVNGYIYWNMVLAPGGRSTWGWPQNAMVTVDPATQAVTFNPEFYVMKHLSRFIEPGAVRLGLEGALAGNAVAFANPVGERVVALHNPWAEPRPLCLADGRGRVCVELPAESFSTLLLPAPG
jgi:glucosylceramidase